MAHGDVAAARGGGLAVVVVRFGDKGAGLAAHTEFCASYIGDILIAHDDEKEIIEIKNYTAFVTRNTECPAVCTLNGGRYLGGNTEERLKYRVLGTERRGLQALGAFNHADGSGYVAAHRGDYYDCVENRKARVQLVTFEAGLGGLLPHGARRLRRLARLAKESGADATDYTASPTARSFVPFYTQRLSATCVLEGAHGIQKTQAGGPPPLGDGGRVRGACPFAERVRGGPLARGVIA